MDFSRTLAYSASDGSAASFDSKSGTMLASMFFYFNCNDYDDAKRSMWRLLCTHFVRGYSGPG